MKNNKNKILTIVAFSVLALMIISGTYAFFAPQQGGTTSTNATVTSNTTDLLTFSINRDISFTVTQNDFQENGTNKSGDATATATLTPNNKTGSATMNYYLYLNLQSNPTVYSEANTNEDPELMLQVFDGNNQLVTLTGLGTQKTIKGVTGYDITGVSGLKTLLDNHAISASNNTATIENWRIVITLINLDINQNDNTGKTIEAEMIIRKDELNLGFTGTIYRNNTNTTLNGIHYINGNGYYYIVENGPVSYVGQNYSIVRLSTVEELLAERFETEEECLLALDEISQNGGYDCKFNGYHGVGTYVTNVNTIRNAYYSAYCLNRDNDPSCIDNWYFQEEYSCQTVAERNSRTCVEVTVNIPYYLKQDIEDNIIETSEVCLWYNSHEFCFEPNYWVETGNGDAQHESTENGQATMNKLQADMETALGTQADSCHSLSYYANCHFGNFECNVLSDGWVDCRTGRDDYCGVTAEGAASCVW